MQFLKGLTSETMDGFMKMESIEINHPSAKKNAIISICQGIMMSPSIYPVHLKVEAIQQISPELLTMGALMVAAPKCSD